MARGDLIFNAEEQADEAQTQIDESLADWGLYADIPVAAADHPTFSLWPENAASFAFWQRLQGLWRTGQNGIDGLCHAGVWAVINNTVPFRKRKALYEDVLALENGAINGYRQIGKERTTAA